LFLLKFLPFMSHAIALSDSVDVGDKQRHQRPVLCTGCSQFMFPDTKRGYSIETETKHLLQHTLYLRLTPLVTVLLEKLMVDQPFTSISLLLSNRKFHKSLT
jgi:hypothetical protein